MTDVQRKTIRECIKTNFPNIKNPIATEQAIYSHCENLAETYSDSISELYSKFAYEKLGQIVTRPGMKLQILKNTDVVEWNSPVYKEYRENERKESSKSVVGKTVAKGEFRCRNKKCGSYECEYYQMQTRSADEGATTYVVCSKCGGRYSFN